jgi:hypothetical protein
MLLTLRSEYSPVKTQKTIRIPSTENRIGFSGHNSGNYVHEACLLGNICSNIFVWKY